MEKGAIVMNVVTFNPNISRKLQVFRIKWLNSSGKAICELLAFPYMPVQPFDVSVLARKDGDFWIPPSRKRKQMDSSEDA